MPNISSQQSVLAQWIKRLDTTRLPVYQSHQELALQALQRPSNSLRDIAQAISKAPTIALIMLREANRGSSSLAEPVQTLENAVSRLGLQRCITLLKQLTVVAEADVPLALRQVWLLGQHLNVQANGLFGTRMARLWQEIHWGSLLFLSPVWPLLTLHPEFFTEWERRVLGNNEPAVTVERELIGLPLTTLCLALAEHWKLPSWIIDGYRLLNDNPRQLVQALYIARRADQPLLQQQQLDQRPVLNNWLNRPANTLVFTCGLVMAAHNSWGSAQCLRWQRLIGLYTKQDLNSIQHSTHQLAVKHARLQRHRDLWQPAQALLWPWHIQRLRDKSAAQAALSAPTQDDFQQWQKYCKELIKAPSAFANTVQLIQHINLALQACGMKKICIVMLDAQAQRAQVSLLHGIKAESIATTFNLKATPALQQLLAQPNHLLINAKNAALLTPQLPEELVTVFAQTHWLLASLSNSRRVVMLLAASQATDALHPITLQGFKKTLDCIERALLLFSTRKR